jgi:hypothetical protein
MDAKRIYDTWQPILPCQNEAFEENRNKDTKEEKKVKKKLPNTRGNGAIQKNKAGVQQIHRQVHCLHVGK